MGEHCVHVWWAEEQEVILHLGSVILFCGFMQTNRKIPMKKHWADDDVLEAETMTTYWKLKSCLQKERSIFFAKIMCRLTLFTKFTWIEKDKTLVLLIFIYSEFEFQSHLQKTWTLSAGTASYNRGTGKYPGIFRPGIWRNIPGYFSVSRFYDVTLPGYWQIPGYLTACQIPG